MSAKPNPKASTGVLTPAEAIAHYEDAVKAQATAANYVELGVAYYIAHRWDEAVAAFEKAVALDSKEAYAHYYLGLLYAAAGQREKANGALERVLQATDNNMLKDQAKARIPAVRSPADLGAA